MPGFNEEAAIGDSLRSLLALDYPAGKLELVAVNDGSTDGTLREMKTVAAHSNGRVHVIADLVAGSKPSSKEALATLRGVSERKNLLVVIERANDVAALSVRNLEEVHVLYADQLNTYDVLVSDDVVFTKAAYEAFVADKVAKNEEDAK